MKLTVAFSTLLLALPLLVEASPSAGNDIEARAFGRQRGGNRQGGAAKAGNANANKGAAAAAAAAKASAAATAAKGGNGAAAAAAAAKASAAAAAAAAKGGNGAAAASATSAAAAASTSVAATGIAQNTGAAAKDAQTSLQLDPTQVMPALAQDGQAVQEAGQVPSATSTNNFINFCLTRPDLPLMNGQQVLGGACNPVPMGVIVAKALMPSAKFSNPVNNQDIAANTAFTITMNIKNLETGNFVNPQTNYFAAPANTNNAGILIGHSHFVVEPIASLTSTDPLDPQKFAFFKGVNTAAAGGVLSVDVTAGLAAGAYRLCSMNTAANHQPALAVVAQHGVFDDCVSFTVGAGTGNGAAAAGNGGAAAAAAASTAAAAANTAAAANPAAAAAESAAAAAKAGAAAASAGKGGAATATTAATAGKGGAAAAKAGAAKGAAKGGKAKGGRGRSGRGRGRGRRSLSSRNE